MRVVTFAALVLRRLWAKRWLLLGSFLGATLVTALLAIVPLYEASIAAIDLVFTFRNAPAVQVDVVASHTQTDYEGVEAARIDGIVTASQQNMAAWYPEATERTLSRELFIIPLETPDWLGLAEEWRTELQEWAAEVAPLIDFSVSAPSDAEELRRIVLFRQLSEEQLQALEAGAVGDPPSPPYIQPPLEATVSRIMTTPGDELMTHLTLVAGTWPESGEQLEVVVGEDLARLADLGPGDEVGYKPFIGTQDVFEIVRVSGVVSATDPGDVVWRAAQPRMLTFTSPAIFDRWLDPMGRDRDSDPWLRATAGFPALTASQTWYLALDRESVTLDVLDDVSNSVEAFTANVGRENVGVSTGLPLLVESFDVRKTVFGGPILAMLALVVAGALYFLVYSAGMTIEREGSELALLRTRGASGWQTAGIHVTQSAAIVVGAAFVAPWVARVMVGATGRIPPMSDLTGGEALSVFGGRSVLPFVVVGALLAFASLGLAIVPFVRRSVLELRALGARPSRTSVWQRYYIDIFLIVLAGVLLFELRQRGLVEVTDEPGLDPFAIASPALFLFAGALLLLRLLPFILRGLGWVMTRVRGMGFALPGWHLGRNPIPYGRLALLIFLTTGFGAFALTYAQTLDDSYQDRAEFATGADARVVADGAGLVPAPEGARAAAVYRSQANPRRVSRSAELLAVETEEFIEVVNWRSDFEGNPEEVFAPLLAEDPAPWGVLLPEDTTAIVVGGVEVPEPWAAQEQRSGRGEQEPLHLMVRIRDASRRLWVFPAASPFSDDAYSRVEVPLDPATARNREEAFLARPLTLQAIWVERAVSGGEAILVGHELLVGEVAAVTPTGEVDLGDGLPAMTPKAGLVTRPAEPDYAVEVFYSVIPDGEERPPPSVIAADPRIAPEEVTLWVVPSRNRQADLPHLATTPGPMPVLLDRTAAQTAGLNVGDVTTFVVDATEIPGHVVGFVDEVPTATNILTTGKMIVDLDVLLHWLDGPPSWSLTGNIARVTEPGELWMETTDPDGAILQVTSMLGLEDDEVEVFTVAGETASFSSRPVQIGLVSILFVGAATGVILALAGVTSYVLIAVKRRTREMGVLRAIGLARSRVAATFAVEQLVVLVLGAFIGVVGGVLLMRLMIPFLQLGEEAEELVPSVLLQIEPGVLGAYLAAIAILMVGSVLWSTRTVSARDLAEVLREGEH